MAYTISFTEMFRASMGGKAWRCYRFDHTVKGSMEVTAASMDLSYIECVVGEHAGIAEQAKGGSIACRMGVSISAAHDKLVWTGSTEVCHQYVTIVGW